MNHPRDSALPSRFRVLSRLGRGAQGAVWEAVDLESNVRVALKTITITRPEQIVRFKSEFRAIRDLRHPNLVKLGELAEESGQWFFTMEIVDGVDFITWVRGSREEPADSSTLPTAVSGAPRSRDASEPPALVARELDAPITGEHDTRVTSEDDTHITGERALHDRQSGDPSPSLSADDRRPSFDEARLRAGLRSLIGALATLHRAGKVHRDLKPSNVLVSSEGRLVLIDFGVVAELADQSSDDGLVIGTSVYMAPEQARAETIGPAADWYAVGVLLFEALTGRPPFRGAAEEVIRLKCSVEAPSPSLLVDGVPRDLELLCRRLLSRDAAARPSAEEIAASVGLEPAAPSPIARGGDRSTFVGRAAERALLERAFADARAGRVRLVLVEGASGVGKSELLARFVDELRAREPRLLVLAGRCHEQERVPYNALDGIVDGLARFLAARSIDRVEPLLPRGLEALGRLFPVLEIVEPIARAALPSRVGAPLAGSLATSLIGRAEAFTALRELLARVAARRPLVLVVDDLQWADGDSLALLTELVRLPGAPPLLFVATARPDAEGNSCAAAVALGPTLERLRLGGLERRDAEALLKRLLARHGAPPDLDSATILDESEGHPQFIDELVRHLVSQPKQARARTLNDAIFARVSGLSQPARALLEVVAVAGGPIAQGTAARAAELAATDYLEQLETLRAGQLVRISGTRRDDSVEPYHDRIRATVYERLGAGGRVRLHRRLGLLLEEAGAGADVLFSHFEKAGERVAAARHAERAAAAAASTLAFDRAAELYRRAVELGRHADRERALLVTALGDALTNAGRAREAAEAFLSAAAIPGVPRDELVDLRRRATEQLLMGGHLEAGLDAARLLLAELGLAYPENGVAALSRLAWRQARLALRPLRWRSRPEAELPAGERQLLDVYWSVGAGLSLVDTVRGVFFVFGGALAALDGGDEARIARALATAAISEAGLGSRWRARRLVDAARRAAESHGSDRARFYGVMAQQGFTFLIDNDWNACLAGIDEAMRLWRASGRSAAGWEWDASEQFACWSLDNLGRLRDVCERVPARIRAAQRAGNRFMEVNFRSFFANVHLSVDNAGEARRDVSDAIGSWLPGRDDFGNQHYLALRSLTYIALYDGSVDAEAPALERDWRRFRRSLMRHVLLLWQDGLTLTAGLALARVVEARRRGDRAAEARQLRLARRDLASLARVGLPMARAATPRIRAGLAALEGDDAAAVDHLREALRRAEATGAALHAAAIRLRMGELVGGSEGAELTVAGQLWMARQGVLNPARMTAALLPGWRHPG